MEIHTASGWRLLRRMTVDDLRTASRRLPGASRSEVVALADQIFAQKISPNGGLPPPSGLGPTAWNSEAG